MRTRSSLAYRRYSMNTLTTVGGNDPLHKHVDVRFWERFGSERAGANAPDDGLAEGQSLDGNSAQPVPDDANSGGSPNGSEAAETGQSADSTATLSGIPEVLLVTGRPGGG